MDGNDFIYSMFFLSACICCGGMAIVGLAIAFYEIRDAIKKFIKFLGKRRNKNA